MHIIKQDVSILALKKNTPALKKKAQTPRPPTLQQKKIEIKKKTLSADAGTRCFMFY
jgi:hypothetical protein